MVKNELAQHLLRDAPFILARDGGALLYALLFDWSVLRGMLGALLLLPRMLKKRAYVQRRVRISVSDMQSCIR